MLIISSKTSTVKPGRKGYELLSNQCVNKLSLTAYFTDPAAEVNTGSLSGVKSDIHNICSKYEKRRMRMFTRYRMKWPVYDKCRKKNHAIVTFSFSILVSAIGCRYGVFCANP
ncbi:hypothetical protein CHS0354_009589 [Potamilus streckersoni]|uniref:Uncharacterized protein n=1 Tax=Potamilus streckersoni TaxID=2493646 RepID=A0AAE0SPA6_9BIVA|nr:hypothetical protein CHS0354_009589 [Potamilus streckersoni]